MFLTSIPYNLEQYVNPNPVEVIGGVSIITEENPFGEDGRVMKIVAGAGFGFIDIHTSKKWFIRVNHNLDYEISFWFKQKISPRTSNFEFSVNAFSCYDVPKKTYNSTSGDEKNSFFESGDSIVSAADQWYFARYILFGYEKTIEPGLQPSTSLSAGNNLIMSEKTTNILVNILCRKNEIRIFDFKVKPLKTDFSTGFVQGSDLLEIWRKNNNAKQNDEKIDKIAADLLLPYNTSNIPIKLK